MLPDRVSNPGPLTYESGALPIALRGPAWLVHELALQVYKIFAIIFLDLKIYYIVPKKMVEFFFILCPRKQRDTSHRCSTCMTCRRFFPRPSSVVKGL